MAEPSFKCDIFNECGPRHLNKVDWSKPDHRRAVAASLIKGAYVLEQDRQKKRKFNQALGPIWWEFFHFEFQKTKKIKDKHDGSIIGAIFKYIPNHPNQHDHIGVPPKYVIAFRGTLLEWRTITQDLYSDCEVAFNLMTESTRFDTSLEAVQRVIAEVGPEGVWLAGHSLGASIALQVGKAMAREECRIETYLFNPPYAALPFENISNKGIKTTMHVFSYAVTAFFYYVNSKDDSSDPHEALRPWFPNLFVNKIDNICKEYIGYFEQREFMESWGLEYVANMASRKSLLGLVVDSKSDREALHLVPSANLVHNLLPMDEDETRRAHSIHQWWAPHNKWKTERYQFS